MALQGSIVELAAVELDPLAIPVREGVVRNKGSEEAAEKAYPIYDWQRLSHAFSKIRGGETCLEIGPGRGYLTTMISRSRKFQKLSAIDIVERKAFPKAVDFQIMNIGAMTFPDRSFDCVVCMEVIEHLEDDLLPSALNELRRVSRGQLIVSVPFNETLPLPSYHKQRFDERRIKQTFPDAQYSLLLKSPISRVPWLLIEEDHSRR